MTDVCMYVCMWTMLQSHTIIIILSGASRKIQRRHEEKLLPWLRKEYVEIKGDVPLEDILNETENELDVALVSAARFLLSNYIRSVCRYVCGRRIVVPVGMMVMM